MKIKKQKFTKSVQTRGYICALLTALLLTWGAGGSASAQTVIDLSTVATDGDGYTFTPGVIPVTNGGLITITTSGNYLITGSTSLHCIKVQAGVEADITMKDAKLTAASTESHFDIQPGATVSLTLEGDNEIKNGAHTSAQMHVPEGATLIITEESEGASLTVDGKSGGNGAAIGGCYYESQFENAGTITINGGNITVNCASTGASIGGANRKDGGVITINGGTVIATASNNAAAIGGGIQGAGGKITINGGTVIATATVGAAIGGGNSGGGAGEITINGGDVTACGSSVNAVIGSGQGATSPGKITIRGGVVRAFNDGISSATIGTGSHNKEGADMEILITGGDVIAIGPKRGGGAGIGSGTATEAHIKITITGGNINASGGENSAGIGGGGKSPIDSIIITGGTITANAGDNNAAAIGGGSNHVAEGAVVITGGSVKMNNTLGPQPTNGEGANVYLNTLTIGDPAVDDTIYVTAGSIGGAICINGVPAQEEVADGKYGIHDVYTRDGGKVYFYLPASGVDVYKTSLLVVDNVGYMRSYIRNNNVANTQTLIIPELVITGTTNDGEEIHGGTTPGEDHIAGWTGDALTVQQSGKYTISMHEGVTTTTKATIKVLSGVEADITLDNVSIDVYNMYSVSGPCAFGIMAGATVRLTLQGDNVLKSDNISAGLQVPYGAALTITEESNGSSLKAYGGYQGAGIGGGSIMPSGDITIYGGNVTATGGGLAPGIGKGNGVNSTSEESNITIYGGTIIAFGGTMGAGIGSGMSSKSGGIITIHGGDVTATGGQYGAGIGAGSNVNSIGSNIKITGGTVRATGGQRAAGIGSGDSGEVGTIEISGGTITASAGSDDSGGGAAGIGYGIIWAGPSSSTGTVIITGGTITATAFGGAGIGDGKRNSGENPITVTITGGSVKTSGGIPGPQPTNGEGADVYLNTLTIGDPAVDDTIYVTAGSIGGAICINGVPAQEEVADGKYGIHDVYTRDGGKVYFYLPASGVDVYKTSLLVVDNVGYMRSYIRNNNVANTQTLIIPELVITGKTTGGDEIHGGTTPGEDHIAGWTGDALTVKQSGKYTISMHEGVTTTTKATIKVLSGVEADITLDNVKLTTASTASHFDIQPGATVYLTLEGDNEIKDGAYSSASMHVPEGATLIITEESEGASLTVEKTGGNGACIGGGKKSDNGSESIGTFTINGGNITVTNKTCNGAAIGSGSFNGVAEGGVITINGGTVTANTSGSSAAAIGGGQVGANCKITINGGTVTATATYGTAIGGGGQSGGAEITINGGNITAIGGTTGAAIGAAQISTVPGTITITGGTILAIGGAQYGTGAGIGASSANKSRIAITITGGDITAIGGPNSAGIGGATASYGNDILISGGTINATGGMYGAGIGDGSDAKSRSTITITGGKITASGSADTNQSSVGTGAGIGGSIRSTGGKILITGGEITANGVSHGTYSGAGIGGGSNAAADSIIITGGTITANAGDNNAAAIGGGSNHMAEGAVVITGGSVKMNNTLGPQPTNGEGANVYLNTLTIGDPAVDDTIYVTAGSIGGADCIDGVPEQADVIAGKYGIHDVYTRDGGKVYFYLPATNGEEEEAVFLTVDDGSDNGTEYANGFARPADDFNEQTLITGLPAIVSVTPADNSVALDGDVVITFNRKMSTDLTGVNVTLNGVPLDLDDASWSPNQDVVTIPYSDLSHGTNYVIRFSGFKDKAKQAITPVTSDAYAFTTVHSYSASGDKTEWDFGMEKFAYNSIEPQTFVITNNGTGALTSLQAQLIGADPAFFEITANLDADNLAAGNTANISVRPIDGLSYRLSPYTATLRLTGDNGFSFLIDVSFRVEKAEPMLEYLNYEIPPIIYFDELDHNIAVTPKDKYAPHLGEITVKYNGSEELPYAPGVYTVTIEISEGRNYLSGFFEVGQFTIYRPPTPYILREVTIEPTLHFDTDPRPDIYYVKSSTDMIITLTPRSSLPEGYVPQVTTNRIAFPDSQSGNIRIALNDDGTYTVRIVRITEPTIVTITAIPDMSIGTSNAPLDIASPQVWSYGSRLYIRSATSGEAAVYHISGRLLEVLPFEAGETRSQFLPAGVYVVRIDGKSHKVLLY